MSVYVSSIQSVKEMLTASIAAFNQKKQAIQQSYLNDNTHAHDYRQKQLQVKQAELKTEYTGNLDDIRLRLVAAENGTAVKIGRIRFPSSTSTIDAMRTAGEMQLNSAQLFLMGKPSHASILSSIKSALTLGRTDYAFALIDGATLTAKEEMKSGSNAAAYVENEQFLGELAAITTAFDSTGTLASLATDLASVPETTETLQKFQRFILIENATASFIPMSVVQEMTPAEVQANLESVNASMYA